MTIDDRLAAAGLPPLPRHAWLEIDETALARNLGVFRMIAGEGASLGAVVKADAYGHGLLPVARVLERAGADRLCVASFDEAVALRDGGIKAPILVLYPVPADSAFDEAAQRGIEMAVSDEVSEGALLDWSISGETRRGPDLVVHVEVESGLTRGGFVPDPAAARAVQTMHNAARIKVGGLWTHIATPESEESVARQVEQFESAVELIRQMGLPVPPRHMAATGGLLARRAPVYEGVRVGLGLYGLIPDGLPVDPRFRTLVEDIRPAMALKCMALRVETFPAGTRVGYGGTWVAQRESTIATLPIGYGDGLARAYSPGAEAIVRGSRVPIVGTIAMDALMVDVTDVSGIAHDDEYVLIGRQGGEEITASELARLRNTIPWEVVTAMSARVPRVYHAGSVLKGLRTLHGEVRAAGGL